MSQEPTGAGANDETDGGLPLSVKLMLLLSAMVIGFVIVIDILQFASVF
jgi:hypothetical protein